MKMEIYPDFREFLQLLNEESVEYLVGGFLHWRAEISKGKEGRFSSALYQ